MTSNALAAAWASRGAALLHAHEARAVYACWLLHGITGTPYLLTRRVDNPFKSSPLRDRAYRAASSIVGVSSAIARIVNTRYGPVRCQVIADAHSNLAAGHTLPDALRKRFAGKIVIGHIGALDHSHKGQGTIIEAARRARESHPHWQFVLLGDGRDEAMLRASAADLDNVTFEGFVSNIADWLELFDVFVFPSLHEGLGSILLDAMAFGLPIVATRVGGIPDIIEDGVNGLLIEPLDAGALVHSIERVMVDSPLSDRLRGAALDRAGSYSPEVMARAYATLYETVLGK